MPLPLQKPMAGSFAHSPIQEGPPGLNTPKDCSISYAISSQVINRDEADMVHNEGIGRRKGAQPEATV